MKKIEVSGQLLEYKEAGKGLPCLFIHGAFSSGHTWRKVLPELSQRFRCIIPEWPFGGHRVPMADDADLSPIGIAHLIFGVLETLDIEKAVIIANDTGGAYAQIFTAQYPAKVSHLILSNCEGFEVFPPAKFRSLKTLVKVPGYLGLMARLFRHKPALKWDMTFGLLSRSLDSEELFLYYVKHFTKSKRVGKDFKKLASSWDPAYTLEAAQQLHHFKKPVLVLWGLEDQALFPVALGRRIKDMFTHAQMAEISHSMTYVQEDQPSAFIYHVIHFLEENSNASPYGDRLAQDSSKTLE